jgi:hypothetical protein
LFVQNDITLEQAKRIRKTMDECGLDFAKAKELVESNRDKENFLRKLLGPEADDRAVADALRLFTNGFTMKQIAAIFRCQLTVEAVKSSDQSQAHLRELQQKRKRTQDAILRRFPGSFESTK